MASYHLHVKRFTRSKGQSAPAAAAYRAADRIVDTRTGEVHDYKHKDGVVSSELILPRKQAPEWAKTREGLWNKAEATETRKNSTVAREFEIALPSELSQEQRRELAVTFTKELVRRHGFAAEVSIHKPSKEGDQRNHHAHILVTTRRLGPEGFTEKTRELDDKGKGPQEITRWRERFAQLQNQFLAQHRHKARVDHRTLEAQGIQRVPTWHKGPAATAIERKLHQPSRIQEDQRAYQITPQELQERQEVLQELARETALLRELTTQAQREQLAEQHRQRQEAVRLEAQKRAEEAKAREQEAQRQAAELAKQRAEEAARERERLRQEQEKERQRQLAVEQERQRVEAERAQEQAKAREPERQRPRQEPEPPKEAPSFSERVMARVREQSEKRQGPDRITSPAPPPEPSRERVPPTPAPARSRSTYVEEGLAASEARYQERLRQKEEQERLERERAERQRQEQERERQRQKEVEKKNRGRGGPER